MAELIRPLDLKTVASEAEAERIDAERKVLERKKKQELELKEVFMSRTIHPEAADRINNATMIAAKQGLSELQVLTFPAKYCNDRGRRINNGDPDWPSSLEGFAKVAYEFYDRKLRPLGYKLTAEIISFPDGMPGDVALKLRW